MCSLRVMRIARSTGGAAVGEAVSEPERKGETANRFKGTMLNSGGVWDMPTRDLAQGLSVGLLREAAAIISNRRIRHRGRVARVRALLVRGLERRGVHRRRDPPSRAEPPRRETFARSPKQIPRNYIVEDLFVGCIR